MAIDSFFFLFFFRFFPHFLPSLDLPIPIHCPLSHNNYHLERGKHLLPQRPPHVFELQFILCHRAALHTWRKSVSALFRIHELRGIKDWIVLLIDRDENVYNDYHPVNMANFALLNPGHGRVCQHQYWN